MKSHFFAYISRMRFIQRWALMRNTAPENVQEHSHQVAAAGHALAVIHNEKFGGCVDPGAVTAAALYHDASEILTGDMPTPSKYDNPTIQSRLQGGGGGGGAESSWSCCRRNSRGVYKPILTPRDRRSYGWSRRRTSSPAYIKCVEELKAGNLEFREAAAQTRQIVEGYGLPEVAYFLDTFMDSFSLTLDQLKSPGDPQER